MPAEPPTVATVPRVPRSLAVWAERLVVGVVPERHGADYLDLPCGDGVLTAALARRMTCGRVLAADPDPLALDATAARLSVLDLRGVDLHREEMAALPVGAFDAALSLLTLPHRAQPVMLLERAFAGLRRGGRLAAAVWASVDRVPPIADVAAAFDAVTGAVPTALRQATALGSPEALAGLTVEAAIRGARVEVLRDVVRFAGAADLLATICGGYGLEPQLDAVSEAELSAMVESVGSATARHASRDGSLVVPVEMAVLVADRDSGPPG